MTRELLLVIMGGIVLSWFEKTALMIMICLLMVIIATRIVCFLLGEFLSEIRITVYHATSVGIATLSIIFFVWLQIGALTSNLYISDYSVIQNETYVTFFLLNSLLFAWMMTDIITLIAEISKPEIVMATIFNSQVRGKKVVIRDYLTSPEGIQETDENQIRITARLLRYGLVFVASLGYFYIPWFLFAAVMCSTAYIAFLRRPLQALILWRKYEKEMNVKLIVTKDYWGG